MQTCPQLPSFPISNLLTERQVVATCLLKTVIGCVPQCRIIISKLEHFQKKIGIPCFAIILKSLCTHGQAVDSLQTTNPPKQTGLPI